MSLLITGCTGAGDQPVETLSGDFEVVDGSSNVSFAMAKNKSITVPGFLSDVSGTATIPVNGNLANGNGRISVDVTSLNTGIEQRDQRTLQYYFGVSADTPPDNSLASFKLNNLVIENGPESLEKIGQSTLATAVGKMTVSGQTTERAVTLSIQRITRDSFRLSTRQPFVFDSEDFGLKSGLERLMEVCGEQLSPTVPVNLDITLEQS